jgi:hypothetical protein
MLEALQEGALYGTAARAVADPEVRATAWPLARRERFMEQQRVRWQTQRLERQPGYWQEGTPCICAW